MNLKKILVFGIIAMILMTQFSLMADTSEYRATSLYYENATGETCLSTYEYNEIGQMTIAVWERLDKPRNSLNFYSYDDKGNLIRKYREYSDRIFSEETYEYDANNNLKYEHFKRSDGIMGTSEHFYDEKGFLSKSICNKYKGWIDGEINYKCNEDGGKISAELLKDGEPYATIDYTYDDNNNLIKEFWDFGGKWNQTFKFSYDLFRVPAPKLYKSSNIFIRNNCDYRLSAENYKYSDGSGGPSTFTYDETGKLINKRYDHSNGLYTKTNFLYDFDGRLTKSYRLYSSGLSGVFSYEYDDNGNMIKRIFHRSDKQDGEETYEYDANGKLIGGKWKNFDSWLTGTMTVSYNDKGFLEKGFFKGENNFDADITFDVDDNGNVIKINWDFSFGDGQTYTFEYEKID